MPAIRTVKTYRCRSGKRFIRLYRAWRNLLDRVSGVKLSGTGDPIWFGLEVEWRSFEEFREWALANGYSKVRCSLDRKDSSKPYTRKNCRWTTKRHNSMRALYGDDPFGMGGVTIRRATKPPF